MEHEDESIEVLESEGIGEVDPNKKEEPPVQAVAAVSTINPAAEEKSVIALDQKGLLVPKDQKEAWRVAQLFLESKAIPKQFTNVAQVFMARQFLLAHGLNPEIAIRQTTIINGTLSIWGDLPLSLVERSGLLVTFSEMIFDKEYKEICFDNKNLTAPIFGARCYTKHKNGREKTTTFTMEQAKTAGLLNKDTWVHYPSRMIQMRARSLNLKDNFASVLSGIAIAEYDFDSIPDAVIQKISGSIALELNRDFLREKEATQIPAAASSG